MPFVGPTLLPDDKSPAVVAHPQVDPPIPPVVDEVEIDGTRGAVTQRVVNRLLADEEEISGDKLGEVAEGSLDTDRDLHVPSSADPHDEVPQRLAERLPAERQAPHRPHRPLHLAGGITDHPPGNIDMPLRFVACHPPAGEAGIELIPDPANRLLEGVVEVGRQTRPFPQCRLKLHRRVAARAHLGGQEPLLHRQLPPQQHHPPQRRRQDHHRGDKPRQKPGRGPPRRGLEDAEIIGRPHQESDELRSAPCR